MFAENSCVRAEEPCIYMLTSCAPMLVWLLLCMTLRMSRQFHQSSMTHRENQHGNGNGTSPFFIWRYILITSSNGVFSQCHVSFWGGYISKKATPKDSPVVALCNFLRSQATRLDESVSEMVSHPTPRSSGRSATTGLAADIMTCDEKRHFFGTTFCFPKSFFNINLCEIFARQGLRDAERLLPVVQLNCMERNRRTVLLHRSNST